MYIIYYVNVATNAQCSSHIYIIYMGEIQFACYFWKREANQCIFTKTQKLEKHHYFECFFQTIRLLCMF
jgi:hypothetical protein